MASVEAFRWRTARACRPVVCDPPHESGCRTCRPPHGDECTCKVLVWRTRWRSPEGKSRSENFDRKRDADAKAAEVESSKWRGGYVDPSAGRQLFQDAAEEWAEVQEWKDSTRRGWPAFRNMVRPHLFGVRLDAITKTTLERTKVRLSERYHRKTVAQAMHRVCAIVRQAFADGKIPRDPTAGFKAAPKRRGDQPEHAVSPRHVPTRADVLAILQATPPQWRAAVALGMAGLRIGETLGMRVDRLSLDECSVTVDAQAVERPGKGVTLTTTKNEKSRTITVPQLVAVELRRHLRDGHGGVWVDDDGTEHEMVFCRPDGHLWSHDRFYTGAWRPALADAAGRCDECKAKGRRLPSVRGCECRPLAYKYHALRHWCASTMLAAGVALPIVAGYIGDHQHTIIRVYAHWLRDDQSVPGAVLDGILHATDDTDQANDADTGSDQDTGTGAAA